MIPADRHSIAASDDAVARPRRRARIAALVCVAAAICAVAWYSFGRDATAGAEAAKSAFGPRSVSVVTATAKLGDLAVYLDGLGTVTALNTVALRSRVDGALIRVSYGEGQMVHAGDPIAEIDGRAFEVALKQAQGQLAKDRALLDNAELDRQRYEAARDAVPAQQIATATANVALYRGAVQVDQSAIDSVELQLGYCKIVSPIDGKIGMRLVDVGNMVHASDSSALAVITQLQPIGVQFSLPQDSLPKVLAAQAAGALVAEAFDRDLRNRLATGTLFAIDNQIDPATGTVRLKAKFDNTDSALFPNQFVNLRLLVDTQRGVVLVPAAAILRSTKSSFAYVVENGDTVRARDLVLGPTEGDTVAVASGISANEVVVIDGADKLVDGAQVTLRKPADDSANHAAREGVHASEAVPASDAVQASDADAAHARGGQRGSKSKGRGPANSNGG